MIQVSPRLALLLTACSQAPLPNATVAGTPSTEAGQGRLFVEVEDDRAGPGRPRAALHADVPVPPRPGPFVGHLNTPGFSSHRGGGTVYSGEPYDDVLFARVHNRNLRAMSDAARAYATTGEEKYATLFRENLRRFAAGEMLPNVVDKKAGY